MTAKLKEQRFMQGVLGNAGLFHGVAPAELAALTRQARVLAACRGDALLDRDARPAGVFVLGYGLVKLALRAEDGRERVLRIVTAGQSFGTAAALLGRASRYEAHAVVDSKLVVVPSSAVCALMDSEPRFSRNVLKALAQRVVELSAEVEAVSLHSSGERLATYLDSLAQPARENGGWTVRLPVSKTLVAARLGMKKETLSRLLRRLAAEGLIEVSRREIAILDRAALARAMTAQRESM
jgi:CRP-like cAMP-binding protein